MAKSCSRTGRAAWKAAKPMRDQLADEEAAAGYFKERARRRNPVVTAVGSGWDLVEYDGDRDELDAKHEIPRLPATLGWQSRRGPHMCFKTPPGEAPVKIQIDATGIINSSDGYLAAAGSWRAEHNVVYELNGTHELAQLPAELRELLLERGRATRAETRRRFAEGETIPEGQRNNGLFWYAVDQLHKFPVPEACERTLKRAELCAPPLSRKLAEKQFRGAQKFVREHPSEEELARAEARRVLNERRAKSRARDAATRDISDKRGLKSLLSQVAGRRHAAIPELDPAALHGPAGEYALDVQPYTEAAPAAILVCTLVAFGSVAHRGPRFQIGGTTHRVNEFCLLVGPTSIGRKGEAMQIGKRPLLRVDEGWASAAVARGFGSGEALVDAVRDPRTEIDEEGEEKIIDAGAADKRLLVSEEEFAHVLAVASREGSTLSALIRSAWDGHRLENRTKRQLLLATDAHVSLLAAITPAELLARTTELEAANGLLNRFLLVSSRREHVLPRPARIQPAFDDEWSARFAAALRFAQQELGDGSMAHDPGAEELWDRAYIDELSIERHGLAGAVCSRAEAHALRLSMLYALLDCSAVVRREHLEAALALWRYCEASARQVFGNRLGNEVADSILDALHGSPNGSLARTEVVRLFGGHRRRGEIVAALALLAELGLVDVETTATGGRPITHIRLVGEREL